MTTALALLAALGAVGGLGGLVALLNSRAARTKMEAEARATGVEADNLLLGRALEMYEKAMDAAERAESRVALLDREVRALRDHVDLLERIMRDEGLSPPKYRGVGVDSARS